MGSGLIAKLLALPDRRGRRRIFALLPVMLTASLLELGGFGLLVSLLNALLGAAPLEAGVMRWATGWIKDVDSWTFAIGVVMFFALKNLALLGLGYLTSRVAFDSLADFLRRLYGHYLRQPYVTHLGRNSAEMLNHLASSAPIAFDSLRILLEIVLEAVLSLATLALLLSVQPELTVAGMVGLFVVGFLFHKLTSPVFRRWGAEAYGHELQAMTLAKESFGAIKEILVSGCQDNFAARFGATVQRRGRLQSLSGINLATARLFVETLMVVGIGGMVIWARETGAPAAETASIVSMFGIAAMRLMPSANRILGNMAELKRRTTVIMALHAELAATETAAEAPPRPRPAGPVDPACALVLDGVRFRYPAAEQSSLTGVSLAIRRGEAVGLVGASGAGKSTLVDVILGLLVPTDGSVAINGHPATCPAADHDVGYVPQHVVVIDDTLRRNVAFGLDDDQIDEQAVWRALEQAHLDQVVRALPQGLDTRLGERGTRLSGGQRQRIGIARALYTDPAILILDEATSALDSETEQGIVAAIDTLRGDKTVIVIAHRLSTVRDCDRLVFMADGAIADIGTFDELQARVPRFRTMVELSEVRRPSAEEAAP
ncbi:MAG TPA: ABC transporter ATP-binding protein [Candidatus Omnitrophota bacterium]|nr:ABC transporter ATP-binding protein [Candidatus Omnitrophota bacterium]